MHLFALPMGPPIAKFPTHMSKGKKQPRTRISKKAAPKRATRKSTRLLGSGDVPVTQRMLFEVRDQLKRHTDAKFERLQSKFARQEQRFAKLDGKVGGFEGRFAQIDARFAEVDARFAAIDARFDQVDAKFKEVDAKFDELRSEMKAGFATLSSEIHRVAVLVEEQNARNRVVLDALVGFTYRQDALETRVADLEGLFEAKR